MRRPEKKTEEKPLRIAGYVRVSSQRQATEGDSLVAQQHEIEQEVEALQAAGNLPVASLEFYVDAGKSRQGDQEPSATQRLETGHCSRQDRSLRHLKFKLDRITRKPQGFR